jgi:hypothetical protein
MIDDTVLVNKLRFSPGLFPSHGLARRILIHDKSCLLNCLQAQNSMFLVQIYAIPGFYIMEMVLVKLHLPPGLMLRLIARILYVGNASFYQN